MSNRINVKPIINKKNGQCNFYIPQKDMPKDMKKDIFNIKKLKLILEGWE